MSDKTTIDLLEHIGKHLKEPDGFPAFLPADPFDVAQVRFEMERIAEKRAVEQLDACA